MIARAFGLEEGCNKSYEAAIGNHLDAFRRDLPTLERLFASEVVSYTHGGAAIHVARQPISGRDLAINGSKPLVSIHFSAPYWLNRVRNLRGKFCGLARTCAMRSVILQHVFALES